VNDVGTFVSCDVALFIFGADKLQPVVHIAVRVGCSEFTPFFYIIGAYGLIAGFTGNDWVREMDIGVDEFICFFAGGANATRIVARCPLLVGYWFRVSK
jgi:hypothetical protein